MGYGKLATSILKNKLASHGLADPSVFRLDLAVTMACNSRCNYCKIWEIYVKNPELQKMELTTEQYLKIFKDLQVSWLHVTGGEPFLRKDIADLIVGADEIMKPVVIDMPTNGFQTKRIVNLVRKILENINCKFVIGVSIDGPEEVHETSRGIKHGWKMTFGTFLEFKKLKEEFKNFDTHINHFISPMNIGTFDRLVDSAQSRDIGVDEISIEVARTSPFFKNDGIPIEFDNKIIGELKKIYDYYRKANLSPRRLLRTIYIKEMMRYVQTNKRKIPCAAGHASIYIDSYGNLFGCSQLSTVPIGNVKQKNIKEILSSEEMKKWRKDYKGCELCLSGCEGVTSIVQDLPFSLVK